jgi:hypothetical protein
MNPRGSPQRIAPTHILDEVLYRGIDGGTSKSRPAAFPGPITPEALPMPADDGRGLHDEESLDQ